MAQQFTNNSRALLTASITSTATSIVIESSKADLFPVANVGSGSLPSASSWFKATLQDSTGAVEIVAVRTRTAGSGVLSNVIRGYDGTTALAFVVGTVVGLRITAEDVQTALDLPNQNSVFTGDNSFTGTNEFTGTTAFTDSVTAPTETYGNSSTALATTAFVQAALQALHPVGSIYTSTSSTNPGTAFGFGTWIAYGAGRVLVGNGGGFTAGATGGSADAITVAHTHTGTTASAGAASGTLNGYGPLGTFYNSSGVFSTSSPQYDGTQGAGGRGGDNQANLSIPAHTHTITTNSTGSSGTNANLQPYVVIYMWNRTA